MVKSANMNGLLDSDSDSLTDCQQRVKARLHEIMQKDQDFTEEDYQKVQHISLPMAFLFYLFLKCFLCMFDFLLMTIVLACPNEKPFFGQLHEDHRKSCQNVWRGFCSHSEPHRSNTKAPGGPQVCRYGYFSILYCFTIKKTDKQTKWRLNEWTDIKLTFSSCALSNSQWFSVPFFLLLTLSSLNT